MILFPQLLASFIFVFAVFLIMQKYGQYGDDGNFHKEKKRLRFFSSFRFRLFLLSALFIIAAGYYSSYRLAKTADRHIRAELAQSASYLAQIIDLNYARALAFTAEDANLAEFSRLQEHFTDIVRFPDMDFKRVYAVSRKPGGFFFGPHGCDEPEPVYVPPGSRYIFPPDILHRVFDEKDSFGAGPHRGEFGAFVSGFAPVTDLSSGEVLFAVGIDKDPLFMERSIYRAQVFVIIFTVIFLLWLFFSMILMDWRDGLPEEKKRRFRCLEAYIAAFFGVFLTFFFAKIVCDGHSSDVGSEFRAVARTVAGVAGSEIREVGDSLEMLENFFAASDYVDREEFQIFTSPMLLSGEIKCLLWAPEVKGGELKSFESYVRGTGLPDFYVFRYNEERLPVSGREFYYPVVYRISSCIFEDEMVLGYDLGSDPVRLEAMKISMATGLCAGAQPEQKFLHEELSGLKIYRYVESGKQRGFVSAAVSFGAIFEKAVFLLGAKGSGVNFDIVNIEGDSAPRLIATTAEAEERKLYNGREEGMSFSFPFFAFGKTYAFKAFPAPGYFIPQRIKNGFAVVFAGLLLTAALSYIVFLLSTRHTDMELQIKARTRELEKEIEERKNAEEALRKRESFIKNVLDNLPVGIAVNTVKPPVVFEYMNDNFVKFYRTTREALQQPDRFWEAVYKDPVFRDELRKRVEEDCASGDPEKMFWQDVPIERDGEETTYISARNIEIKGRDLMVSTVWDVTANKKAEDTLNKQIEELKRWHDITLGREKRVIELKKEINELLVKMGRKPRYESIEDG